MKSIQTQLQRAFALCIALQIAAVAFMTIPQLEGIRTQLAGSIGLSTNLLWLPISALLALSFFGILKALNSLVANPIANLARRALEGEPDDFTKQKSSSLDEEAILKRFVAKQTQRVTYS